MPETNELIQSYLPMTEPGFLCLYSLVGERHGYGIMQHVSELTAGRVSLGAGTVYTILYKMENDGLIRVVRELERRKVYQITPQGSAVLAAESNRLIQLAGIVGAGRQIKSEPVSEPVAV